MGSDRSNPVHDQLRRESAALRAWSAALRLSSEAARARSRAARTRGADRRGERVPTRDPWASLEPVPVSDLFLILVEHHHLGVRESVSALALEMGRLGCPDDAETIPAADAIDMIQAIVHPDRRPG